MSENNTAADRTASRPVIDLRPRVHGNQIAMRPFFIALFGIWITLSSPALAETVADSQAPFEAIDAQKLIDHCWDISLELRSGSTQSASFGFIETLACLRKTIVEQTLPIIKPGSWSPAYAEWLLTEVAGPYADLFDKLYNAHRHCFCGTQYTNMDLAAVSHLYETLLRDVVDLRNRIQL